MKFPFIHSRSAPVSVLPPAGATAAGSALPFTAGLAVAMTTGSAPAAPASPVATAKSSVLSALDRALADLAAKKAAYEAAQSVVSSLETEWQAALSDIEGAFRGAAGAFERLEKKVVSLL